MAVPEGAERRGLSRRDMIRASAAAGVVAWTAPMIIDSLTSPAAATSLTPPCGCSNFTFNSECGPDNQGTKCNIDPTCAQSNLLGQLFTATCNAGSTQITYTGPIFPNCTPGIPQGKQTGTNGACVGPDTNGGTYGPWTFNTSVNHFAQFSVFLTCPACPG